MCCCASGSSIMPATSLYVFVKASTTPLPPPPGPAIGYGFSSFGGAVMLPFASMDGELP